MGRTCKENSNQNLQSKWNHLQIKRCVALQRLIDIIQCTNITSLDIWHISLGSGWGYDNDIIFKHQKRALRAVTSSRYSAHTGPLFINMKLLKVKDIHKLSQLKFFYKRFHRELPEYFNTMLTRKPIDIHDHSTRKRDTFLIERMYHSFTEKCIRNSILHIVNGVPHAIKDKVSTHSFHGFSQYLYNKGKTRNLQRYGIILAEFGSTRRFVDLLRWTH